MMSNYQFILVILITILKQFNGHIMLATSDIEKEMTSSIASINDSISSNEENSIDDDFANLLEDIEVFDQEDELLSENNSNTIGPQTNRSNIEEGMQSKAKELLYTKNEIDSIKVMSWNIANQFNDGETFRRLLLRDGYSCIALQEPTKKFNKETIKYTKAKLAQDNIILIPSPLQYLLINETTLGNGMITTPIILLNGRIMAITTG